MANSSANLPIRLLIYLLSLDLESLYTISKLFISEDIFAFISQSIRDLEIKKSAPTDRAFR
jgi:hypothetical protein